jgi:hypothetical protein
MMNIEFDCIWEKISSAYRGQAISLWDRFNTFSNAEVTRQRAEEIACVAIRDGNVIGLTSVRAVQLKHLNNNFFCEMRVFVSPENESPLLVVQLAKNTKQIFEQNPFVNGNRCVGIIALIENKEMNQRWRRAVWPVVDMIFAGFSSKGEQVRITYFKNATI